MTRATACSAARYLCLAALTKQHGFPPRLQLRNVAAPFAKRHMRLAILIALCLAPLGCMGQASQRQQRNDGAGPRTVNPKSDLLPNRKLRVASVGQASSVAAEQHRNVPIGRERAVWRLILDPHGRVRSTAKNNDSHT